MNNITRYKIDVTHYRYISDAKLKQANDGDVVKYEDHVDVVNGLNDEIHKLKEYIKRLEYSVTLAGG